MELSLRKMGRQCSASGSPFKHGDSVVSLVRAEAEGLHREDYHLSNWCDEHAAGAVAVWRTVFRDPEEEQRSERERGQVPLRDFFYEALARDNREGYAHAFLAAQLLRRQRLFRLLKESGQESEDRILLFLDLNSNAIVQVPDPNLSMGELRNARAAVESVLRGESASGAKESNSEQEARSEYNDASQTPESTQVHQD